MRSASLLQALPSLDNEDVHVALSCTCVCEWQKCPHLSVPYIHADHTCCPSLQQAVCKPACGHARVQCSQAAHVHVEVVQCGLQLEACPAWRNPIFASAPGQGLGRLGNISEA